MVKDKLDSIHSSVCSHRTRLSRCGLSSGRSCTRTSRHRAWSFSTSTTTTSSSTSWTTTSRSTAACGRWSKTCSRSWTPLKKLRRREVNLNITELTKFACAAIEMSGCTRTYWVLYCNDSVFSQFQSLIHHYSQCIGKKIMTNIALQKMIWVDL